MQLVKIKTTDKEGNKNYYPLYLVYVVAVGDNKTIHATRIYTHKDDAKGFNTLNLVAEPHYDYAKISDYIKAHENELLQVSKEKK